jgi:diaminohydroxyphosphoribosylaminopyrimidine deaminase/5-amino-6-(5-phosphoribosylamino)uracil reductase
MRRCIDLARKGQGKVGNGALVGAVLVRNGMIIAEAYHQMFGACHAERALLEAFHDDVMPTDTLYVNLEPCCHQGKTPPCTDSILARGIKNVVFGMHDPDSRAQGRGIALLQSKGVNVIQSAVHDECAFLNRGFFSVRTKGRPWISLKKAQTIQGAIANSDRSPMCITTDVQNAWSHEFLRSRHDAILVGVGTVIHDNPKLNKRFIQNPSLLTRIILDPSGKIPVTSLVLQGTKESPTIVIVSTDCTEERKNRIAQSGAKVFSVKMKGMSFDWDHLWDVLITPKGSFNGLTSLLVEGGEKTWNQFFSVKAVDCAFTFIGEP